MRRLENSAPRIQLLSKSGLGIALGVWTIWFETGRSFGDRIEKDDQAIAEIEKQLAKLEATAEPRVDDLDREVGRIRRELEALDNRLTTLATKK